MSGASKLLVGSLVATVGALAGGAALLAQSTNAPGGPQGMSQVATALDVIRQSRVLFLHQSVGFNIIDGIKRLDVEHGGNRLRVVSGPDTRVSGPAVFEMVGGENTVPKSKIDAFAAVIREKPQLRPDLAFMKLCYVDFNAATPVGDVFAHYRTTLETLKRDYPGIKFAHVTVPLTVRPSPLKRRLSAFLGKQGWSDIENAKRAEFNQLLLQHFAADPIFDLATAEATAPDGSKSTFDHAGKSIQALYEGYTEDGGHLNTQGQTAIGATAIRFIADGLRRPGS